MIEALCLAIVVLPLSLKACVLAWVGMQFPALLLGEGRAGGGAIRIVISSCIDPDARTRASILQIAGGGSA